MLALPMSGRPGKADIAQERANERFDPKQK